jgi:hypothetical protein
MVCGAGGARAGAAGLTAAPKTGGEPGLPPTQPSIGPASKLFLRSLSQTAQFVFSQFFRGLKMSDDSFDMLFSMVFVLFVLSVSGYISWWWVVSLSILFLGMKAIDRIF